MTMIIRDVDGLIAALCESKGRIWTDNLYLATSHARIRAIVPQFVVHEPELPSELDAAFERVSRFVTDAVGDYSNPIHADLADIHEALTSKALENVATRMWWDGKTTADGEFEFAKPQNVTAVCFPKLNQLGYDAVVVLLRECPRVYYTDKAHLSPAHKSDETLGPEKPV